MACHLHSVARYALLTLFLSFSPLSLSLVSVLLFLPNASALQNVTVLSSDSSINYQPSQGVWNAVGDSGASNSAYRLARTQDGVATITRTFRSLYFTSPLWSFPLQMAIMVGSTTVNIDLQDHSVASMTPPPMGLAPSSKSTQIRWSWHGTDAQRTVQVTARSSSTGWIALVNSFIFEVAQPGDPPVSSSPPSQVLPPPSSGNGGNGNSSGGNDGNNSNSGGNNGNGSNLGMPNSGNNSPPSSLQGSGAPSQSTSPSSSGLQPSSGLNNGLVLNPSGTTSGASLSPSATDSAGAGANSSFTSSPSGTIGSPAALSGVPHSSDSPLNPLDPNSSQSPPSGSDNHNHKKFPIGIIVGVICGILFLLVTGALILYYARRRRRIREAVCAEDHQGAQDEKISERDEETQQENPFDDAHNISSETALSNATSRPNDSSNNSPLETAGNTSYLGETSPASPPTTTTLGFGPWILYDHNRRASSFSTTSSQYSRSSNALDEECPAYVQGISDLAGVVVAGPQNFMQSRSATLYDTTNISTDGIFYVISATETSPTINPLSTRPVTSSWTHPHPHLDSNSDSIETTADLVPVCQQRDQGLNAPRTISLSLPAPFDTSLDNNVPWMTPNETQLLTRPIPEELMLSPSPAYLFSIPESQVNRGFNRASTHSASAMLSPARTSSNVIGHHPTRSQLSIWSSADLATPPPQYCSRESRAWDQFDDGTANLAHEIYARQHQELMRSLEGYLSATLSQTNGSNAQVDTNNRRGPGELPTPPASERGGKSGK